MRWDKTQAGRLGGNQERVKRVPITLVITRGHRAPDRRMARCCVGGRQLGIYVRATCFHEDSSMRAATPSAVAWSVTLGMPRLMNDTTLFSWQSTPRKYLRQKAPRVAMCGMQRPHSAL